MDNIDKFIKEELSHDIILPNSFCNTILNCSNKKEKIKQHRHRKIIKAIITSIMSILYMKRFGKNLLNITILTKE